MTRSLFLTAVLTAAAAASVVQAKPAGHYAGQALAPQAKVPIARAQAIALKARPGVVTDKELEKEAGGSGLRYSFDIKSHGVAYEVGVDAATGAVLENAREGAHPD